jgi:hypothetical protein
MGNFSSAASPKEDYRWIGYRLKQLPFTDSIMADHHLKRTSVWNSGLPNRFGVDIPNEDLRIPPCGESPCDCGATIFVPIDYGHCYWVIQS